MALLAKAGASGCGDLTVKEADFMGYSWHIHGDKRYIIYTDNYWYIYIYWLVVWDMNFVFP